jgi:hypothetical protein
VREDQTESECDEWYQVRVLKTEKIERVVSGESDELTEREREE